jgi:hypothetical protein
MKETNTQITPQMIDFLERCLDPEMYGYELSPYDRDVVRVALGREAVETVMETKNTVLELEEKINRLNAIVRQATLDMWVETRDSKEQIWMKVGEDEEFLYDDAEVFPELANFLLNRN